MQFESIGELIQSIAIVLPRIGAAFIILPLLTQETVPALVRNSLFVVFAIILVPTLVDPSTLKQLSSLDWALILAKEIFIGIILGLLFGSIFWSLSVAGGILDSQIGLTMANMIDPLQGHQASPTSQWLSRFGAWLFMASGGFIVFMELLYKSYAIWPLFKTIPDLHLAGSKIFIDEFEYIMLTALLFAAPAILLLALVDLGLGLINRFAQQLNVLSITMPIKSWIATFIMAINLGLIVELVIKKIADNQHLLEVLKPIL